MQTWLPRMRPLRVAVLCSHRAPALTDLLKRQRKGRPRYQFVACVTSEETCPDAHAVLAHGIPVYVHLLRPFAAALHARWTDLNVRAMYDAETVRLLAASRPDLIALDAYLYQLTDVMLDAFPRRIINLHHSDLSRRLTGKAAPYAGLRAVRDAVLAGETETRATAHLVTPAIDGGPPFLRSCAFPVSPLAADARRWQARDMLKAYVYAHQEWMIRSTWGPLLEGALTLIGDGRIDLNRLSHGDPVWALDRSGEIVEVPLAAAS
jgi:folate-dependent phosphoribosylglycinamide formyltransferase PurN